MRFIILFFISMFSFEVFSQDDMPIQVEETPYLSEKGSFQFENALTFKKVNTTDKVFLLPSTLIKYGLNKFVELRVTTEFQLDYLSNQYSLNPIIIGFKTKILKEKDGIPEMALVSQVAIPKFASKNNQLENFAPELQLMMQGNYSDLLSMNYNTGIKWDGFSNHPIYTYKLTTGLTYSQKWSSYSEIFGVFNNFQKPESNVNNGIMYLINNNMILDASAGFGISEQSAEWFSSLIYSFRF